MTIVHHTKCANRLHAGHASTAVSQSALVHLSDSIEPRSIPTGNSKLGMLNPLFVTRQLRPNRKTTPSVEVFDALQPVSG